MSNNESVLTWWKKVLEVSYPPRTKEGKEKEKKILEEIDSVLEEIQKAKSFIEDSLDALDDSEEVEEGVCENCGPTASLYETVINQQQEEVIDKFIEIMSEFIDERIMIMRDMGIPFDNSPSFYKEMEKLIALWFLSAKRKYFNYVSEELAEEGEDNE